AQLGRGLRRLANQIERVLDVLGAERLPVVPSHVASQEEDQFAVILLPLPSLGELADDGVRAMRGLQRIEQHEVAESRASPATWSRSSRFRESGSPAHDSLAAGV